MYALLGLCLACIFSKFYQYWIFKNLVSKVQVDFFGDILQMESSIEKYRKV